MKTNRPSATDDTNEPIPASDEATPTGGCHFVQRIGRVSRTTSDR